MKRLRVPLSAQVTECELDKKLGHFLLEPVKEFPDGLLIVKSLNTPGELSKIYIVNMTWRWLIIYSSQLIGQVDEVTPPSVSFRFRFSPRCE